MFGALLFFSRGIKMEIKVTRQWAFVPVGTDSTVVKKLIELYTENCELREKLGGKNER